MRTKKRYKRDVKRIPRRYKSQRIIIKQEANLTEFQRVFQTNAEKLRELPSHREHNTWWDSEAEIVTVGTPGNNVGDINSPEMLWEKARRYFRWVENTPIISEKINVNRGLVTRYAVYKERPAHIYGLCLFLGVPYSVWIGKFVSKEEYSHIVEDIYMYIHTQKLEHGMANMLNPALVSKDLGLKDRVEIDDEGRGGYGVLGVGKKRSGRHSGVSNEIDVTKLTVTELRQLGELLNKTKPEPNDMNDIDTPLSLELIRHGDTYKAPEVIKETDNGE